jgi:signal transduction histidine kinase
VADAEGVLAWLHDDDTRVRQALLNYAINAVKFTSKGRTITLLGLAIAKRFTQLMGGTAGELREPGRGSTFWFTVWLGYGEPVEQAGRPEQAQVMVRRSG